MIMELIKECSIPPARVQDHAIEWELTDDTFGKITGCEYLILTRVIPWWNQATLWQRLRRRWMAIAYQAGLLHGSGQGNAPAPPHVLRMIVSGRPPLAASIHRSVRYQIDAYGHQYHTCWPGKPA